MTSVPPTQPPAAPGTDVRLTEAEQNLAARTWYDLDNKPHRTYSEQAVERIVAERVRVVEGERDAARSEHNESCATTDQFRDQKARAEAAEAAHRALQAAVEALAERLTVSAQKGRQDIGRDEDTWAWVLDEYAEDLRELAGGAR